MQIKIMQPLWYHPTNVMLVDDDVNLLKSLIVEIDPNFSSTTFTNPKEAAKYLEKNVLPLVELSQSIISDIGPNEEKHLSTENIAIDFSPLHEHLDKPTRFTKIVIVVVDKAMKEMDGLDFCRMIRQLGLPVKFILLTGHTSTQEAVIAFNNRVIDAFVEKSADISAMMSQVNSYINMLAFQTFCDSTIQLLGPISMRIPFLTHETMANFLKDILQKHRFIEYYVLDTSGSCLLITAEGSVSVLLIKSSTDFTNAYDLVGNDDTASTNVLEALKARRAFPFTGTEHSFYSSDVTKWQETMTSMKKHPELDLYYGIVEVPKKVMSFDHYVNQIWKPEERI